MSHIMRWLSSSYHELAVLWRPMSFMDRHTGQTVGAEPPQLVCTDRDRRLWSASGNTGCQRYWVTMVTVRQRHPCEIPLCWYVLHISSRCLCQCWRIDAGVPGSCQRRPAKFCRERERITSRLARTWIIHEDQSDCGDSLQTNADLASAATNTPSTWTACPSPYWCHNSIWSHFWEPAIWTLLANIGLVLFGFKREYSPCVCVESRGQHD